MKRLILLFIIAFNATSSKLQAQIGIGTTTPDASAQLHISATSKGLLIPSMTAAQRSAIASPATGLLVYQTDGATGFYFNFGTPINPGWRLLISTQNLEPAGTTGQTLHHNGTKWVANNDLLIDPATNQVGIGTVPSHKLHVAQSNAGSTTGFFENRYTGPYDGTGVWGRSNNEPGYGYGGFFQGGYYGVYGQNQGSNYAGNTFGVFGYSAGTAGTRTGVYGQASGGEYAFGIYASAGGGTTANWAGWFNGNVNVNGTLSKAAGTFKIDHPQDPANKYLVHSFVESPDMMNVYNGNITTGANGEAVVSLPGYFEAENIDYKYQLTVIGQFAQAIVFKKISNNQFTVKTDKPNVEVSWQVTGVRNDAYARKNRIVPEVEKKGTELGRYLQPELFGQPSERGIGVQQKDRGKGSGQHPGSNNN